MHVHHFRRCGFDAIASISLFGALLLSLAGCGFQGEPPFAGRQVPGVAPWQDIGPITLCDGDARLGPLSFGALGTCDDKAAPACATDADCASREGCLCGRCALPVCDSAEECGPGRVCSFDDRVCNRSCASDADCAHGEQCVPGKNVCRGLCATGADCQHGESCDPQSGRCLPESCASDSECAGSCRLERLPAALAEPSPLVESGGVTMWLERTDPMGAPAIWRATSADGITFTFDPPHALLSGRAPSVLHDPERGYLMLYALGAGSASSLALATSSDGVAFTPSAAPVLAGADQPSLIAAPMGGLVAYYLGADGTIGRATSTDGAAFTAAPPAVLTPAAVSDPILWRGVDELASPFAQALTDPSGQPFVRLWFSAHGTESAASQQFGKTLPTPPDFSIGEAASTGGAPFVPYPFDPVFDRVLEFLTHPSELDPAVIALGDSWLLYYRRAAADGSQSENLAVARSPVVPR